MKRLWWVAVIVLWAGVVPPASAQSITKGTVSGSVQAAGEPVWEARVILIDQITGVRRTVETGVDGLFSFSLLPTSEYELRVEKIPYGPVRIAVPVRPRRFVVLPPIELQVVEMPVQDFTVIDFSPGAVDASRVGNSRFVKRDIAEVVPGGDREVSDLTRFVGLDPQTLVVGGLPARYSSFLVEGVPVRGADHPAFLNQRVPGSWLSDGALDGLELVFNGADVELAGAAGGWLVGYPKRGRRNLTLDATADFTNHALDDSRFFTGGPSYSSTRAGVSLSGPIVRDTSHFALGIYGARINDPRPRAWTDRGIDQQIVTVASDSFGVDVSSNVQTTATETNLISGFGRLDVQIGDGTLATVSAGVGYVGQSDPGLQPPRPADGGGEYEALEVTAVGTLASGQLGRIQQELRVAFATSRREYTLGSGTPRTDLVDAAVSFGTDPALPAFFNRTDVTISETLFGRVGDHNVKLGLGARIASHDQTYANGRPGRFAFGGVDQWAAGTGAFEQAVGTVGQATYSNTGFFFYLQDTWIPAPRVQLTFGMRSDLTTLPTDRVPLNQDWLTMTGVTNNGSVFGIDTLGNVRITQARMRVRFSPRLGLAYELGRDREWVVSGGVGVFVGELDPGLFSDLLLRSGALEMRRGVGALGNWPAVPDSTAAPVRGPSLALVHPEFEAPRSFRASVGIARDLGRRSAIHASLVYRHTDYLPRLHNLNRLPSAVGLDQYDRPVWGTLSQMGGALFVDPATNRRFSGFDYVTAVDPDGYSDHVGLTVGLERQVGETVRFLGQYTYSRTTDNWLGGGRGIEEQLNPFPDSLSGRDWAEGTSDFDIPHRATGAVVIAPRGVPVTLSAFYRFQSGAPFTPGFPFGVDANGDGSSVNDPVFVDPNVPGAAALLTANPCLAAMTGRFADRNSCRGPGTHRLDLRLAFHLVRAGVFPLAVTVEGVNVTDTRAGIVDGAVYRIDPTGSVTTTGGVTTVPLEANPTFGQYLIRTGRGRALRLGLKVGV